MREILKAIGTRLSAGEALVLVTVTAATGATPRGAGARMLVGRQGRICGTIGGGAVEYRSEQIAQEVLNTHTSRDHDFTLTRNDIQDLGMICGGTCSVFFHYLPAEDPAVLRLAREAEACFAAYQDTWLVCDLSGGGSLTLVKASDPHFAAYLDRKPRRLQVDGRDLYIEQISFSGRTYIFGGGHVAQELVPLLQHVGFRCTVLEDREAFAKKALFPAAEEILLCDFNRISDYITIREEDYVCVMTRGHAHDTLIQAQILKCHPCYCGVIGSASKAAGVRKALKEDYGLTETELDQITTPIGLKIKAETPAEIAVSIAAQMILHRAGGRCL